MTDTKYHVTRKVHGLRAGDKVTLAASTPDGQEVDVEIYCVTDWEGKEYLRLNIGTGPENWIDGPAKTMCACTCN